MRLPFSSILLVVLACNESKTVAEPKAKGQSDTATTAKDVTIQNKDNYRVDFLTLCDESKGRFFDESLEAKYGVKKPYHLKKEVQADSVFVTFDFISSCCEEYSGNVEKRVDTVVLKAVNKSLTACDCRCDYRLSFRMLKKDVESKEIKIDL